MAFALGSMVLKRAYAEGAGLAHALVINNVILGVLFLPLLWIEPKAVPWKDWSHPVLTGAVFLVGHLLNVASLRVGDVSVATPILGAKVIFIAILGWAGFGLHLEEAQWLAAGLATTGVIVMGATDIGSGGSIGMTTLLALGCAASFALTDILIQLWGGSFGVFNFLPLQFATLGLLSLATLPFFGPGCLRASPRAWRWILAATALSAVQAILITGTIAVWKDAAGVNVVYATRGLWSIACVWLVGHWFENTERRTAGNRRMGMRLIGAGLIVGAVVLIAKANWR